MSFADELADNTRQAMVAALLRTVVSDPKRTIGDVLKALKEEKDASYLPDMFRGVTILQLVQAAAERIRETGVGLDGDETEPQPEGMPPAEASGTAAAGRATVSEPPDDPDAGPEDNLEDEPERKKKRKAPENRPEGRKGKKGKGKKDKKGKGKKDKKDKKDKEKKEDKDDGSKGKDGHLNLVDPKDQNAYQSDIVKHLRKNKCIDFESGHSSTQVRKGVGGDPKQFRDSIDPLVKADRVGKGGEARGVRYFVG